MTAVIIIDCLVTVSVYGTDDDPSLTFNMNENW